MDSKAMIDAILAREGVDFLVEALKERGLDVFPAATLLSNVCEQAPGYRGGCPTCRTPEASPSHFIGRTDFFVSCL